MVTAFITPGPVQVVAVSLLVLGVWLLVSGARSERFSALLVGAGALLATLAVPTAYRGFLSRGSDGPTGWVSVDDIYTSLFGSWSYVWVVALCATALWTSINRISAHRWSASSVVGALAGSLVAAVMLGVLDSSI